MTRTRPLFQKSHYECLVERLALDTHLTFYEKLGIVDWLIATMEADNPLFRPEQFKSTFLKLVHKYNSYHRPENDHDPS